MPQIHIIDFSGVAKVEKYLGAVQLGTIRRITMTSSKILSRSLESANGFVVTGVYFFTFPTYTHRKFKRLCSIQTQILAAILLQRKGLCIHFQGPFYQQDKSLVPHTQKSTVYFKSRCFSSPYDATMWSMRVTSATSLHAASYTDVCASSIPTNVKVHAESSAICCQCIDLKSVGRRQMPYLSVSLVRLNQTPGSGCRWDSSQPQIEVF